MESPGPTSLLKQNHRGTGLPPLCSLSDRTCELHSSVWESEVCVCVCGKWSSILLQKDDSPLFPYLHFWLLFGTSLHLLWFCYLPFLSLFFILNLITTHSSALLKCLCYHIFLPPSVRKIFPNVTFILLALWPSVSAKSMLSWAFQLSWGPCSAILCAGNWRNQRERYLDTNFLHELL